MNTKNKFWLILSAFVFLLAACDSPFTGEVIEEYGNGTRKCHYVHSVAQNCDPPISTTTTSTSTTSTSTTSTSSTTTTIPEERPPALWWGDPDNDIDPGGTTPTDCLGKERSTTANELAIVTNPDNGEKVYRSHTIGSTRAEWAHAYEDCDGSTKFYLWGPNVNNPPGDELWVGWRSKFTGNFGIGNNGAGSGNDGNLLQFKGYPSDCGGPNIGMTLRYNRLSLRTIDGAEPSDPTWPGRDGVWMDEIPFDSTTQIDRKDVWTDFVIRVNFKMDSTGWIELWVNGEPQLFADGTTRYEGQTVCPGEPNIYFKAGFYDGNSSTDAYHWMDDPRIGTSYAEVAP